MMLIALCRTSALPAAGGGTSKSYTASPRGRRWYADRFGHAILWPHG
jgi:hypothetical protein